MIDRLLLHASAVGVVSPAGFGAESLTQPTPPEERAMQLASSPSRSFPFFAVDRSHPRWRAWAEEPRLRRSGGLAQFLLEAIRQALAGIDEPSRRRMGLIAAFNNGSIAHIARFFAGYRTQGRRFASPLLFPETVYNAATSHAAAVLGLGGPSCSIVGDESAWVEGLRMARVWIELGHAATVLLAASEEVTPVTLDAFRCAGWLRRSRPFRPAEGAVAVLLTAHPESALFALEAAPESLPYTSRKELLPVAARLARKMPSHLPVYSTAQGSWLGALEKALLGSRPVAESYPYLGEAFPVSAGWQTIRAATLLSEARPEILVPVWGSSHQLSWLHLRFVRHGALPIPRPRRPEA
ncbi:beta-ketoacyl synthase N-terminal-like domain-containing protein [Methylacidimicrobium sp. B4]|uniref:beta-ketoacyl synthase N-terminal-like domain-containing protein n=1 Tax=Methylacidimicrobium sp. B4 TaxID=2796139 RepID=UPI001A8F13AC|nr:beta-ketoacyl synthase N-terminal-like domain-containing protein [Methylacidimicrobium sp. B4]QSR85107.1 hypothetical protein MacB4_02225 [Methylacidimicrobium sp. B4]